MDPYGYEHGLTLEEAFRGQKHLELPDGVSWITYEDREEETYLRHYLYHVTYHIVEQKKLTVFGKQIPLWKRVHTGTAYKAEIAVPRPRDHVATVFISNIYSECLRIWFDRSELVAVDQPK